MSEHYDFHYQPTGSGAISGQQVLEQTEDAINELGDYVNDNIGGAMDVAQQALETAQNAEQDAQTALDTANSFSSAIQSAQQDASTALSTAQTAQNTASNANNTAIQASQDASSAVTTANNASGQVSTLSGTVTALGQRVTTAEGNIGQNTSDITALTTRVGTAEGNITTLQNDVTIAQGNASSAMATAGQVKQQAFVFRYSSTALVASSTNSNTLLDNTDNLKVGDKVIDSSGVLFSVTAIDTANSTFTIGTALIDLANDADVVHKTGNETISGNKTFSYNMTLYNSSASVNPVALFFKNKKVVMGSTTNTGSQNIAFRDSADTNLTILKTSCESVGNTSFEISVYNKDSNNQTVSGGMLISQTLANTYITPTTDNTVLFGSTNRRWSKIYGTEYYYGSNNVEFSTKFVTTDTNQDVAGEKTFNNIVPINGAYIGNEFSGNARTNLYLLANRDVKGQSGVYVSKFRQNRAQGEMGASDVVQVCFDVLENSVRTNSLWYLNWVDWENNVPKTVEVRSLCEKVDYKLTHINGLNPSSLSMPDLSNGIDISSYITNFGAGTVNEYTPVSDGWISIANGSTDSPVFIRVYNDYGFEQVVYSERNEVGGTTGGTYTRFGALMIPCVKNVKIYIIVTPTSSVLASAKFFPCQGNV